MKGAPGAMTANAEENNESNNCDFSPLKDELRQRLILLQQNIAQTVDALDGSDDCMLGEFADIRQKIHETEMVAGSFYLKCYLSSYTSRIPEISTSVSYLSQRRFGALIVVEREERTAEYVTPGTSIDAFITHSLLASIFMPGTPLHDGAVILRGDKIVSAASVLPLSVRDSEGRKLGTRHRAALGLSERCDALIIVVSEETGRASFALGGKMYPFAAAVINA